jgi:hypothetical protein
MPTLVDIIWSREMHSPGLVAMKTLWEALVSLPHQGSLVIAPKRQPSHLGRMILARFQGKLLELGKAQVAKLVVPTHEFSLITGGRELDVFSFPCLR